MGTLILKPMLTFLRGNMNEQLGWVSPYTLGSMRGELGEAIQTWLSGWLRLSEEAAAG